MASMWTVAVSINNIIEGGMNIVFCSNVHSNLDGKQVIKWILHPPLACLVGFSRGAVLNYRDLGTGIAEWLTCSMSAGFCLYGLEEVASEDRGV